MFIVFEGVDFTGKTTISKMVHEKLAKQFPEKEVQWFRAPDGPIRDVLLNRDTYMDGETEVLLFTACHRWLIDNKIKPTLDRGGIVVLDRFIDSTISYQGGGRELGVQFVQEIIERHVQRSYRPDMTIFVKTPEEIRERRRAERGNLDFMDQQGLEFRRRNAEVMDHLYNKYETAYFKDSNNAMLVNQLDNDGTMEELEAAIDDLFDCQLPLLMQRHERRKASRIPDAHRG